MHRIRIVLWPIAIVYRMIVCIRNLLFDLNILPSKSFKIPVISIGNITVGGTGKTPHVEYLAGFLQDRYRVAVLSRGYKRKTRNFLPVTLASTVSTTGDEPLQIKRKLPSLLVVVDRDRVNGIRKLIEMKPRMQLIILDDAFQHRRVTPGLSILLVDYNRPVFHDMLLPAGNLREPWKNIIRADIIIITKCPPKIDLIERARFISQLKRRSEQDIFFTKYAYGAPVPVFPGRKNKQKPLQYKSLQKYGGRILLVTGIADPEPLRNHLSAFVDIAGQLSYADHHRYSNRDLKEISLRYSRFGDKVKYIFTTEKDAVRLRELDIRDKHLRKAFYYIPVEVKFLSKGEKPFIKRISKFLKKNH